MKVTLEIVAEKNTLCGDGRGTLPRSIGYSREGRIFLSI